MLNIPNTGFLRTYIGQKDISGTAPNALSDTPVFGSTNFQPYINRDFEMTQSFIYTNSRKITGDNTVDNEKIYYNIQSDSANVRRSVYTYPSGASYFGVYLIENYFLAIRVN